MDRRATIVIKFVSCRAAARNACRSYQSPFSLSVAVGGAAAAEIMVEHDGRSKPPARLCRCVYQQGTSLQSPVHGVVTGVLGNRRGEQPVIGNHLFQGGDPVVVVLPMPPFGFGACSPTLPIVAIRLSWKSLHL